MRIFLYFVLCLPLVCALEIPNVDVNLAGFLDKVNTRLAELLSKQEESEWFLEVNGEQNATALQNLDNAAAETFQFLRGVRTQVAKFKRLNVADAQLKRKLEYLPDLDYGLLGREDAERVHSALANISNFDEHSFQTKCVENVDPFENIEQLTKCWQATGQQAKDEVKNYWKTWLPLYRKTANLHAYTKPSDYWLKQFGMKSEDVLSLMQQFLGELQPIIVQFQAHIRQKLRSKLGADILPYKQPIPFTLYDAFVQKNWNNIETPYAGIKDWNISTGLMKRGLNNAKRTFLNVAEFYRTMGFPQLPHDFFQLNALPTTNSNKCPNKIWNFFGLQPVRMSYCNKINADNFFDMFETVSELFFFNAAQLQPAVFQKEPLGYFNDGIAKFFVLIANSPKYLEKLKLVDEGEHSKEQQLNYLYKMGFRYLLPLPMLYIVERYRTKAMDSKNYADDNCYYWQLVEELLGAKAPVERTNADFDIAEKLLTDVNNELASAFMSIIFKFQLFKHFCEQTGQFVKDDPMHTLDMCDLTNQKIVGQTLMNAMSVGASASYRDVLQKITGEDQFNVDGIIEYFKPLFEWLEEQNDNERAEIGWNSEPMCKIGPEDAAAAT